MRLYLIKRKRDGKFLRNVEAYYSNHTGEDKSAWSNKPAMMLRTADGVAGNLRKLCSESYFHGEYPWQEMRWRNFDKSKLELFEVVCMDVDVISMTATPATDFARPDQIENIPLSKSERRAA